MLLYLGKRFAVDGTILRIGLWELILMPRPYEAVASARWVAIHKLGPYICIFLGRRALVIRHCA
jgi:hypothetical protein